MNMKLQANLITWLSKVQWENSGPCGWKRSFGGTPQLPSQPELQPGEAVVVFATCCLAGSGEECKLC